MKKERNQVAGIVLAAGHGTRMESTTTNKVTLELGGKPMIEQTVELLEGSGVCPVVVVVGFQKESVINVLRGKENVIFAEQKERLGTGHAAAVGFETLPKSVKDVFILNGDDSAFYTKDILTKLLKEHRKNNNAITFLTLKVDNPSGLGRIIRNKNGKVIAIFEEKDASTKQRKIKEINPACYLFSSKFLKKYISHVPVSRVTGEYYIVSLVSLAIKEGERVEGISAGNIPWRGVNTKDELTEAEKLFSELKQSN